METRQCRNCRKLFLYRGNPNCPECVREMDDLFVKVREYMYEYPRATMEDICENVGVDEEYVMSWLREGRLILGDDSVALLQCETCGVPIQTGRWCAKCQAGVRSALESGASALRGESGGPRDFMRKPSSSVRDSSGMHIDVNRRK